VIVRIDASDITLDDPDDCTRFHVQAAAGVPDVGDRLAAAGAGTMADDEHAWVGVDALRALAAGHVAEDWPARFDAMLAYAGAKGWVHPDGGAIRAHLERD
jgi:hypothetical protein